MESEGSHQSQQRTIAINVITVQRMDIRILFQKTDVGHWICGCECDEQGTVNVCKIHRFEIPKSLGLCEIQWFERGRICIIAAKSFDDLLDRPRRRRRR